MSRAEHVEAIKRRIETGDYKVSPEQIAEAMLHHADEYNSVNAEQKCAARALAYDGLPQGEIARRTGLSVLTVGRLLRDHDRPAYPACQRPVAA